MLAQGFACQEQANAGLAMVLSQRNFKERTHKLGRANIDMAMTFDDEANSIISLKPMVYLIWPAKMKKGDCVLFG